MFSIYSNNKIVPDYNELVRMVEAHRTLGATMVLTIGSWDMLHIGHLRYLNKAREHGDVLVVGVDSDEAIKRYKGEDRPIIPETERMEMLSYQDCVTYVTLVDDVGFKGEWYYGLLKMLRPNIFVAVEDSYPEEQKEMIKKFCGELVVLPRQAEDTSSSEIIQRIIKKHAGEIKAFTP